MAQDQIEQRPKPEAFRFELRRATRPEHESLDAHPAFAALMNGTLDVGGYQRLMILFHGFYARHDRLLAQSCERYALNRLGFAYAPRTSILAKDLAALGVPPIRAANLAALPPIDTAGTLGGMLYVFEGSMLGGGVLCRAVESLLEKHDASGSGYWRWCREAGAGRWAMTCAMLDRIAATEAEKQDMIAGAQAAFVSFADWLAIWRDPSWDMSPGRC